MCCLLRVSSGLSDEPFNAAGQPNLSPESAHNDRQQPSSNDPSPLAASGTDQKQKRHPGGKIPNVVFALKHWRLGRFCCWEGVEQVEGPRGGGCVNQGAQLEEERRHYDGERRLAGSMCWMALCLMTKAERIKGDFLVSAARLFIFFPVIWIFICFPGNNGVIQSVSLSLSLAPSLSHAANHEALREKNSKNFSACVQVLSLVCCFPTGDHYLKSQTTSLCP